MYSLRRQLVLLVSLISLGVWSGGAMAAVAFQAAGTAVTGTGAVTVVWPAHASGDIALLFVESTGGQAVTLSTPATFVAVANSPQSIGATTAGTRLSVFWARATSAAMTSPVVADPGDHVYARIITYRGAIDTGNPWDVTGGGTTARSLILGSVTTTVANTRVVQAASRDNDSTAADFSAQTNASLSGITERSDAGTTSGTGGGFAVWDGVKATAGAIGTTTTTLTASVSNAYLSIALRPSGASAPAWQATGTAVNGTGAVTVAWPAHAIGDIALLFVESAGGEAVTLSTPATFAAVTGSPQSIGATTAGTRLSVFWARATSAAMTSPVVADPGNHVYARIITYRGVIAAGNPWDVTGGGTDSNLTVSGVTTTVANTLVVQAASREDDSTAAAFSAQTNANLSGITEQSDAGSTSGNGGGFAVWDGGKATAGATGNTTVTRAVTTTSIVGNPFLTIALKPLVPTLHHVRIEHDGAASVCAAESITLKACANAGCTTPHYVESDVTGINLSPTSAGYTWSPSSTVSILAASSGINSGITLARSSAGTATLATTGTPSPVPAAGYECYNTATSTSGDCSLVFSAGNMSFNVPNHVAETRQVVTLTACNANFASTTRTIKFWSTYLNPASGTLTGNIVAGTGNADCTTGYSTLGTSSGSSTSLSLSFGTGASPQATFSLCYPDVGEVTVDARYDGSAGNTPPDAGVVITGTDSFIARPDHFAVTGIKCTTANVANCAPGALAMVTPGDNPAATDQTGGSFMRAGNSTQTAAKFTATITAKSARNTTTKNFGVEAAPGPEGVKMTEVLVAPSGGSAGLLTCKASTGACVVPGGAANFSNGATTVTDLAWSEAGIMQIMPKIADADYLGTGEIGAPTASGNIGRFIPDRFVLTTHALNPVIPRSGLTQTTTTASGTTAPATVIDVAATTGFAVGSKVRIPGAGAAGAAFTATVTAVDTIGTTLTLDTPISTTLDPGDIVIEEWGSYMGEGMTAQFSLDAVNVGGAITTNYRGVYAMLNPAASGNPLVFGAVSSASNLTTRLDTSTAACCSFAAGSSSVAAPIAISRGASPDGPYTAVEIGIAPVDSDGVKMTQPYDLNVGGSLDHTSIMSATVQASTEVRFGRLRLLNALGSELLKPRVDYRLEYWDVNRWITNTVDSWAAFVADNVYTGGLGAPSSVTGPTGGAGVITFNTAAVGSYDIAVNLNAAGNDTSCNTTGHGGTAANKPWLKGYWSAKASCNNTDPWLQDPNARVKLGSPKAPYIYLRERY